MLSAPAGQLSLRLLRRLGGYCGEALVCWGSALTGQPVLADVSQPEPPAAGALAALPRQSVPASQPRARVDH